MLIIDKMIATLCDNLGYGIYLTTSFVISLVFSENLTIYIPPFKSETLIF